MGSVMKRANGRTVIQWTDGNGRQRQQVVVAAGQDGRPLSDRAIEQLARRRLAELEEQGRRHRLGLEPLRAESLSMTFGALMDWWWAIKGKTSGPTRPAPTSRSTCAAPSGRCRSAR
jgi:hypothetical protein